MIRAVRPASARIDLGLAILSALRTPGEQLTVRDIAAWADCSPSYIHSLEQSALRKLRAPFVNNPLPMTYRPPE